MSPPNIYPPPTCPAARYLAPELLQGDVRHLDKADMFALGATLYELAGGSPLPRDASVWGRIKGRRPGETVPPWPGISNSFKCLIMVSVG
jgi:wee1-like protein kinase